MRARSFTPPRSRTAIARAAAERKLALGVGKLALELAALVDDRGEPGDHLVGSDLEELGSLAHPFVLGRQIIARGLGRERLDTAHAGSDRALTHDLEEADIARSSHMGATAQLDGISVAGLAAGVA